jgi:hypothetical protein
VPRKIFGPKREHGIGGWKKMNNNEVHDLYLSPGTGVIKSCRMS